MSARQVILAERRAANDNFVDCGPPPIRPRFDIRYVRVKQVMFEVPRTIIRVLMTATFSLLLLIMISATFLVGLGLVGLFAAGLAVSRLVCRHVPSLVFPIYQVDPRAPG
jgi:hypothetical protein